MLSLIVTNGYEISLIEQDVRGHQNRIIKESDGDVFLLLACFVFVLRHAFEFGHARDAVQHPGEFRVLFNVRLNEDSRNSRIDSDSEIDPCEISGLLGK